MSASDREFRDMAASGEVVESRPVVIDGDGGMLAAVRVNGRVHAVDNECPHRGGELGQGDLVGYLLHCPLHAWSFDVRSGNSVFPQGESIGCYAVREVGGRILVAARRDPVSARSK
jgi:nitrite reductase (NADH) small subunit